jgi:hypothetical protein
MNETKNENSYKIINIGCAEIQLRSTGQELGDFGRRETEFGLHARGNMK